MSASDLQMALLLQKQFDMEIAVESPLNNLIYKDKKKENHTSPTKSLVDPSWEVVDPTPNVHILFMAFNEKFFWNKLLAVSVSWSKRMTTCAGICSYEYRGGLCKITLSEPLLKLRPRKDLVETLLHEMIHALLFVTNNDKDRSGHGPEFHKHMYRINKEAGTNITVYHDFHDEVRLYQQHWWRCNGPCQKQRPYYGFVRRSMNRAPGPNDRWWSDHKRNCSGTFIKIKEPEKITKGTKSDKKSKGIKDNSGDIRKYIKTDNINTLSNIKSSGTSTVNKNGTFVLNPKTNINIDTNKENIPIKHGNIFTINDIKKKTTNDMPKSNPVQTGNSPQIMDYSLVRNKWLTKFENNNSKINSKNVINEAKRKIEESNSNSPKKPKTENKIIVIPDLPKTVNCPLCNELFIESQLNDHLDECLKKSSNDSKMVLCPVCNNFMDESILNNHLDNCLKSSENKNEEISLIHCEICENFINSNEYPTHTAECLNKFYDDIEKKYNLNNKVSDKTNCLVCNENIVKTELDSHLDGCMGSAFEGNMDNDDTEEKDSEEDEVIEISKKNFKEYNCPLCLKLVSEVDMNEHIDICLAEKNFDFSDF